MKLKILTLFCYSLFAVYAQKYDFNMESILPNFFFSIFFFGVKLGHFSINNFFSVCNKNASLPAKNRKNLR